MTRIDVCALAFAAALCAAAALPAAHAAAGSDHLSATGQAGPAPTYDPQTRTFSDRDQSERGWQGLADLLERAAPSVNTAIPLSASQITDHIRGMLDAGQNQAALDAILSRQAQIDAQQHIGDDVQLMFLHARALSALGRHDEAIAILHDMTVRYPELPEPWNNLAVEYVRRGELDRAREALKMALVSDPDFAPARANLGYVQMALAAHNLKKAGQPIPDQAFPSAGNPAQ
ncbi:MAG: tetratricopeptide repeat protein [Alcaligenaceae bacterium]|nr:tetratricopeptide repeat protein [Alcaligenaceae bacterium]